MNEQSYPTQAKHRSFLEEKDQSHFAAFLNLARNNVFICLHKINAQLIKDWDEQDDAKLRNCPAIQILKGDAKPLLQQSVIDQLNNHFPFLKLIVEQRKRAIERSDDPTILPKDYFDTFDSLLYFLIHWRDFYSHIDLSWFREEERDRTELEHLLKTLRSLFQIAIKRTKERFIDTLWPNEYQHLWPFDKGGKRKVQGYHYQFIDQNSARIISEKGFVFFTCLFLEPRDSSFFLKRISGFKDSRTNETKNSLRVFQHFHIRVPKPRIESGHTKQGLLLDILQDLWRCPSILFERLKAEDRDKFLPTESNDEENMPALIRYDDNFHQLVQRFLDYSEKIKEFRFGINISQFYYKVYDKKIGGEDYLRRLNERLYIGERIQHVKESEYPTNWQELIKDSNELALDYPLPYIRRQIPHYLEWSNNVLLFDNVNAAKWAEIQKNEKGHYNRPPQITADYILSKNNLSAWCFYLLIGGNRDKLEGVIRSYKHNLIRFIKECKSLFETSIPNPDSPFCPEVDLDEIRAEKKKRIEELQDQLIPYSYVEIQDIPHSILHFVLNIQEGDSQKAAMIYVQRLKDKVEREIKNFKNHKDFAEDNKKMGILKNKAGKLASEIVEKLLFYQDPKPQSDHGNKATGMQYAMLQSRYAFFGRDKDLIPDLLSELNLSNGDQQHPFLNNVKHTNYTKISTYYLAFLQAEIDYLDQLIKQAEHEDISHYHFIKIRKEKPDINNTIKNLASTKPYPIGKTVLLRLCKEEVLKQINAKRKNEKISIELSQELDAAIEDINSNASQSLSLLVKHYFKLFHGDRSQYWYDLPRHYDFIDKLKDSRKGKSMFKPMVKNYLNAEAIREFLFTSKKSAEYLEKKRILSNSVSDEKKQAAKKWLNQHKRAFKNEGILDQFATYDILKYLMAKELLADIYPNFNIENSSNLQEISFEKDLSLINQEQEIELKIPDKNGSSKSVKARLNLKKVGNLEWLVKDRRMKNLKDYYPEQSLDYEIVKKELDKYQNMRSDAFAVPLKFEKMMQIKTDVSKEMSFRELANHFYNTIYPEFKSKFSMDAAIIENVVLIRNAIAHNEYPAISNISLDFTRRDPDEFIIEKMLSVMEIEINKWLEILALKKDFKNL